MRGKADGLPALPLRIIGRCAACGGGITIDRRARLQYYRCSRRAYQKGLCRERRFCRIDRAHEGLERICRSILFDGARSLCDLCGATKDAERMVFLEQVFESVTLSPDGIVDFKLKPLWIQAVVRVSHLLNAA